MCAYLCLLRCYVILRRTLEGGLSIPCTIQRECNKGHYLVKDLQCLRKFIQLQILDEFIGWLDITCYRGWVASWWVGPPSPSLLISKKRGKHDMLKTIKIQMV